MALCLAVDLTVYNIVNAALISLIWDVVEDWRPLKVNIFLLTV